MTMIVLDSNVLVAYFDRRDNLHSQSRALIGALDDPAWESLYFDCILNEVYTVISRRLREQQRMPELPGLFSTIGRQLPPEAITWTYPEIPRLYREVVELMLASQGSLSYHDALIALAAREAGVTYLASFDSDFDILDWISRIDAPSDVKNP